MRSETSEVTRKVVIQPMPRESMTDRDRLAALWIVQVTLVVLLSLSIVCFVYYAIRA